MSHVGAQHVFSLSDSEWLRFVRWAQDVHVGIAQVDVTTLQGITERAQVVGGDGNVYVEPAEAAGRTDERPPQSSFCGRCLPGSCVERVKGGCRRRLVRSGGICRYGCGGRSWAWEWEGGAGGGGIQPTPPEAALPCKWGCRQIWRIGL